MGESKAAICVRKSYSGGVASRIGGKLRASASSMTRCSWRSKKTTWIGADFFSPGGASDTGQVDDGLHAVHGSSPTNSCRSFAAVSGGPSVRRTTARLRDRRAVLAGDDQGTEQVDPAFEVVLLGVEVDADEVRVQVGLRHRQACCCPCRGCS